MSDKNFKVKNGIDANGAVTITQPNTSTVPLTISANTLATGSNLLEIKRPDGTVRLAVGNDGALTVNSNISFNGGNMIMYPANSGQTPLTVVGQTNQAVATLIVKAGSSQSANLQEWQDSSGTVLTNIAYDGAIRVDNFRAVNGTANRINLNGAVTWGVTIPNNISVSAINLIIKAAPSQTADLQQWQNSSGTVLTNIDKSGYIRGPLLEATPTNPALYGIAIFSNANQTGDLFHITDSSYNAYTGVSSTGRFVTGNTVNNSRFTQITTAALAQLTVYAPSASTIGAIIRGAASQTADLQQWQNSSGTVLASIDANGSFTSASQPIQISGSTYGFNKIVTLDLTATTYWKIATLPTSTLSTYDQINIDAMLGSWGSTGKTKYEIMMGNRDVFAYKYKKFGDGLTQARIVAYTETDGSVSVYLYSENTFTTLSYNITLSTAGNANGATIYKNPSPSTTTPTGTKSFDSSDTTTYPPLININNAGSFSTNSAIFKTASSSVVPLIVKGASSQSANLQDWQNSGGGILSAVTASGGISINNVNSNALGLAGTGALEVKRTAFFDAGTSATIAVIVRGRPSQTANLQEWQDSAGTVLAKVNSSGIFNACSIRTSNTVPNAASEDNTIYNLGVGPNASAYGISWLRVKPGSAGEIVSVFEGTSGQTGDLTQWRNNAGAVIAKVDANGNFSAISKSFDIPHPTKENMRLRYASLEGSENGVYIRGTAESNIIELPDYWTGLVHEDSITVSLTAVGSAQNIYVEKIENNKVYIGGELTKAFFTVYGERKDIDKLVVES